MSILKSWDKFDDKMRDRAIEELLRFMMLVTSSAAMICFLGTLINNGDMTLSFVLLTFMVGVFFAWNFKRKANEKRWGVAKRRGAEIFRIGMEQPTEAERLGMKPEELKEEKKKEKKKNPPQNPSKKKRKK